MTKKILNLTGGASPVFAWRLPTEIAGYKQGRLPASQWANVIKGFAQKGIKAAEISDSKIIAWLEGKGGEQLLKQDVAEFASFSLPSIKELRLSGNDAEYKQYSWAEAGWDYNESLFYFPTVMEDFSDRIADLDESISALNFDFERLGEDPDLVFRLDSKRMDLLQKQKSVMKTEVGPVTHFSANLREICPDARADFAHMRWSTTECNGIRTLFIHEMQSDWAQKGRANEWSGDYKPAPLVMETEHWTAFLMRRGAALAVEHGCEQITWINGTTMANGGRFGSPGLDEFYMKIVPSVGKKIAKPFKSELALQDITLRNASYKMAVMPVTQDMRARFAPKIAVYSYSRVVEKSTFNPVLARMLQQSLQLCADNMFGEEHGMRVAVVRDILSACEHRRPAGALIGRMATVAFGADDPVKALNHEAFHFAYKYNFTSIEQEAIAEQFSPGAPLMVRTLRLLMASGEMASARQAAANPEEAAAHAFSLWKKGQMSLSKVVPLAGNARSRAGITNVIATYFPAAERFVQGIAEWMRSGSTGPSDFVAKILRIHESQKEMDMTDLFHVDEENQCSTNQPGRP